MTENFKRDDNQGEHLPESVLTAGGFQDVPLEEIATDGAFQVRAQMDEETVQRYVEIYVNDGKNELPPVQLLKNEETGKYEIINGHHRVEAARRAGLKAISAHLSKVNDWATESERKLAIYALAASHNVANGLQFTVEDQMNATRLMLTENPRLRFSEVHAATGVKRSTFYRIQAELRGTPWKQDRKESTVDYIGTSEEMKDEPTVVFNEMIFCGNGCGTPAYPETLEAAESTWVKNDAGTWFCCEECRDEAESKALEAAGTAILKESAKQEKRNVMADLDAPKPTVEKVKSVKDKEAEMLKALVKCAICNTRPEYYSCDGLWYVKCPNCAKHKMVVKSEDFETKDEAREFWNMSMNGLWRAE